MTKTKRRPAGTDNFLELIPEITCRWDKSEGDNIFLLVPRFRNPLMKKLALRLGKSEFVRINLDASGSQVWRSLDGCSTILDISRRIPRPDGQTEEQAVHQLADFISILARNKFVSLKVKE